MGIGLPVAFVLANGPVQFALRSKGADPIAFIVIPLGLGSRGHVGVLPASAARRARGSDCRLEVQ